MVTLSSSIESIGNSCQGTTVPGTLSFFLARCCLGQVPGGAPFSQRSELATACTSRMQIKNRTKRIDKASKAKQITNWNQKVIRCVQTHAGKKGEASRNASGRGYWVYTCSERPQGRLR